MFTIKSALDIDGPSILRMTATTGVFTPTELSCVEELWTAYRDKGQASGYAFLVYCEDGWTLGYACFGPHPLTQGTYDLYWIAVDPVAQGRGIGHALLAGVEAEVLARGGRMLLVETSSTPAYASARQLYEGSGYHYEAIIHDFYAPGDNLLIFSKDLGQAQFLREALGGHQQVVEEMGAAVPTSIVEWLKTNNQHPFAWRISSVLASGRHSTQAARLAVTLR
jgi:GNAT superfamily N-acetyltransferase